MDFTIKVAMVFLVFVFSWLYQEQNQSWDLQRNMMKYAVNHAAHDAALQIDDDAKSRGHIVIDVFQARSVFEESLRLNLGLNESLSPNPGSPMISDVRILHFEVFDDANSTFPFLYENATYGISHWIYGPSVFAVIESDHPYFVRRLMPHKPIRVPVIEEYLENRL